MKAFPNLQHDEMQVTLARLVLFWSRDSQIWLHIRIYWGTLKNMAMPRLYPKSIRLEYPAVRSHQCFLNIPDDFNMQLRLRIMLLSISQTPPILRITGSACD